MNETMLSFCVPTKVPLWQTAARFEDELQANADMTFDLIGNLGTIDYKTADSKEIIVSYER